MKNTVSVAAHSQLIIFSIFLPKCFYLSYIYAHVGHNRRALSVLLDVVIIRHGARQKGGVHCSLCAACPMTE